VRQHIIGFCVSLAVAVQVHGRDVKAAHTGLNISEADWNKNLQYLVSALAKFKVPEKEKSDVLGAISGLKGDIVGR